MFFLFYNTGMVGARVGMTISVIDWIHVDDIEILIDGLYMLLTHDRFIPKSSSPSLTTLKLPSLVIRIRSFVGAN